MSPVDVVFRVIVAYIFALTTVNLALLFPRVVGRSTGPWHRRSRVAFVRFFIAPWGWPLTWSIFAANFALWLLTGPMGLLPLVWPDYPGRTYVRFVTALLVAALVTLWTHLFLANGHRKTFVADVRPGGRRHTDPK